jgi:hypothetical protein
MIFKLIFCSCCKFFLQKSAEIGVVFTSFKLFPEIQIEGEKNYDKNLIKPVNRSCKVGNLFLEKYIWWPKFPAESQFRRFLDGFQTLLDGFRHF